METCPECGASLAGVPASPGARCPACAAPVTPGGAAGVPRLRLRHTRTQNLIELAPDCENWIGREHLGSEFLGQYLAIRRTHLCIVADGEGHRVYAHEGSKSPTKVLPRQGMAFGPEVDVCQQEGTPISPGDHLKIATEAFVVERCDGVQRAPDAVSAAPPAKAPAPKAAADVSPRAPSPPTKAPVPGPVESAAADADAGATQCPYCAWTPGPGEAERDDFGEWRCRECGKTVSSPVEADAPIEVPDVMACPYCQWKPGPGEAARDDFGGWRCRECGKEVK